MADDHAFTFIIQRILRTIIYILCPCACIVYMHRIAAIATQ